MVLLSSVSALAFGFGFGLHLCGGVSGKCGPVFGFGVCCVVCAGCN